ncbi:ras-related and estrogen-regulated growth inhibitor-like protein [Contarinia nasturtii]|uniref:ras-related and estrogen-regulated growth inhibitor-like protein n=1 Tax=Contarinia nasturtii TaxID=265458 RepID=UPI0012D480BC|nr:ras-related and estrogen-regulated growth inhibitor-like protein [Contarinia nasturtii]
MNSTSPKSSLAKIAGLHSKPPKPFRILILGTSGVGKTAMIVRFITRRFIGEYTNLEQTYTFNTIMDNEPLSFEILDAKSGHIGESDNAKLEANIKWADAYILMYSVTDKCSFDECNRLKFLINYNKRKNKKNGSNGKDNSCDVPVMLVANKVDMDRDRMIASEEGKRRYREIGCVGFREISVREHIEQVWDVFHDISQFWQVFSKCPKLKRSTSEVHQSSAESIVSPESTICSIFDNMMRVEKRRSFLIGSWTERSPDEYDEGKSHEANSNGKNDINVSAPFRERASTDGTIFSRPRRWHYPARVSVVSNSQARIERRMSISMRGSNASY